MARQNIDSRPECQCCGRRLTSIHMLELDQRINAYHDFGNVPAEQSQGWFPFGPGCARKATLTARAEMAAHGITCS
jgi:hypothetical protein